MYLCVRDIGYTLFYDVSIGLWHCSDSVVILVLHFYQKYAHNNSRTISTVFTHVELISKKYLLIQQLEEFEDNKGVIRIRRSK